MPHPGIEAFYLEGTAGRLFSLLHRPPAGVIARGALAYFAPFAEEMNKSRRMAALQARELAERGWWVLQPDMLGCGDSEGDFGDAAWATWVEDAVHAVDWLAEKSGLVPALWGLRAGCLLATAVAHTRTEIRQMLFWQPVSSGKQHLQQFLRLKVASAMLGEGRQGADGTRQLREQLQQGEAVEVAGYMLTPALALGLDAATLAPPAGGGRTTWLEVSAAAAPEIAVASRQGVANWQAAGWQVDAAVVSGAAFWQTQEIEEVPALIAATSTAMAGAPA